MLVPWQNLRSSQGSSHPAHSPAPYFSPMGLNSPADPHPDFFSSCLAKCSITKLRLETSFHLWLPPLGLQNHKTCSVLCNIIILPFGLQTWVGGESEDKKIIILEFPYGSPQSNTQLPHHCKNSNNCCKGKNNKYSALWLACATAKWVRMAGIHRRVWKHILLNTFQYPRARMTSQRQIVQHGLLKASLFPYHC